MQRFLHETFAGRIVFGAGALGDLSGEVEQLGLQRVLLISTPGRRALAERAAALLGARVAGIFDRAEMHAPEANVLAAEAMAKETAADGLVSCGGGSPIGIAKVLAKDHALPIIAVATTYSGSEMTPQWSMTKDGLKQGGRNALARPKVVVYDPELTLGLPVAASVTSAINAMAHCVEALYAEQRVPSVDLIAQLGIAEIAQALPRVVAEPEDVEARAQLLHGGHLGGAAMCSAGMAIHHKVCHVLGGTFGLPHAETHTVVLPHACRYNAEAAPEAMARIAAALGADNAARGIFDLAARCGAPASLKDLGLDEGDLDRAAEITVKTPYYNPRKPELAGVREMLDHAFRGERP